PAGMVAAVPEVVFTIGYIEGWAENMLPNGIKHLNFHTLHIPSIYKKSIILRRRKMLRNFNTVAVIRWWRWCWMNNNSSGGCICTMRLLVPTDQLDRVSAGTIESMRNIKVIIEIILNHPFMISDVIALIGKTYIKRRVTTLGVGGKIDPRRVFFGNGKILLVNTIVTIFYCKGIISTKLIAKNTCRWVGGPVTADGIEILWLSTNYIAE